MKGMEVRTSVMYLNNVPRTWSTISFRVCVLWEQCLPGNEHGKLAVNPEIVPVQYWMQTLDKIKFRDKICTIVSYEYSYFHSSATLRYSICFKKI